MKVTEKILRKAYDKYVDYNIKNNYPFLTYDSFKKSQDDNYFQKLIQETLNIERKNKLNKLI